MDGMKSGFPSLYARWCLLHIFLSVNKNFVQNHGPEREPTREMSFVFTLFHFTATFDGSILLALLEKCSMERIWVLMKRVKETLVARFPDS